jgi:hypothetical protein
MGDVRQDKYEVGDRVTFKEQCPYTGSEIPARHMKRHGAGPYLVEVVENLDYVPSGAGHTQRVTINDKIYSGAWFEPRT